MVNESACERAFNMTSHPVYRNAQFIQFFLSTSAVFPFLYFLWFKLWKSSFHGNLKWLLTGYLGSTLSLTLTLSVLSAIQIIHPLLITDKCELIFGKKLYGPSNILLALNFTLPTFFPISITIERFLAMKLAEKYDQKPVSLGPFLTIFNILLDFFLTFCFYWNETFEEGTINLMFYPESAAPKITTLLWILIILNLVNFFFNFKLLRKNSRLKRIDDSLSAKHQLEEIYLSTVFSVCVTFLHVTLYGMYLSLMMFSRYFGYLIVKNPADLTAYRGAQVTFMDICNLIIGTVAVMLYKSLKAKKSMKISGTIGMKSTGGAGARNYDQAINDIWNSHARC